MEEAEIAYITANMRDLVKLTQCNVTLLNILQQNDILSEEDVQNLVKFYFLLLCITYAVSLCDIWCVCKIRLRELTS